MDQGYTNPVITLSHRDARHALVKVIRKRTERNTSQITIHSQHKKDDAQTGRKNGPQQHHPVQSSPVLNITQSSCSGTRQEVDHRNIGLINTHFQHDTRQWLNKTRKKKKRITETLVQSLPTLSITLDSW